MPTPQAKAERIDSRLAALEQRLNAEQATIQLDREALAGVAIACLPVDRLDLKCLVCQTMLLRTGKDPAP